MPCTTILIGKKASYDGSTIVARNEDSPSGEFCAKRLEVMKPEDQPRLYKSVLSHVEIPLPEAPVQYTYLPNSDTVEGIWGAYGVNEKNVSMTATETLTTNARVAGGDPLVVYRKAQGDQPEIKGGIGEEDLVTIVLPYISSAREGVQRLGNLLETYGTYEMNGIAFQDENEIWWLETIGGHNWIAKRVPDNEYVVMPNQLGIDSFDLEDAYGEERNHMCSGTLRKLIEENHLDLRMDPEEEFNPRDAFGSHDDSDHVYNTPRAWAMLRYFNPRTYTWDGPDAEYGPEDDDLPWSLVPEKKITVEDVKWVLSNHYQGTPYDVYGKKNKEAGIYRAIGVNRNNALGLVQIRPYVPEPLKVLQWLAVGSNVFNVMIPVYPHVDKMPEYLSKAYVKPTTESFYWVNRIIGALADAHYYENQSNIERYQAAVDRKVYALVNKFDREFMEKKPENEKAFFEAANQEISDFTQEKTTEVLDKVLFTSSSLMRNGFSRSDS